MDKIVYKYELTQSVFTDIKVHQDARVLKVGEQNGRIFVWIELPAVDVLDRVQILPGDKCDDKILTFSCIHTGQRFPELWQDSKHEYLDTVMLHDGAIVVHVYQLIGGVVHA